MASVLGGFAGNYNRRHGRSGYVFQNRFTSILCDEDSYLLELIRYIHLNPIRAKMIDSIAELGGYPWTGHAGVLGGCHQKWHAVEEVLSHFGKRRRQARNNYLKFVSEGLETTGSQGLSGGGLVRSYDGWESIGRLRKEHILCIGDERILGKSEFVEKALEEDRLGVESKARLARMGWTLEKLLSWVANHCEVQKSQLYNRSREGAISRAKALICFLAVEKLGIRPSDIATELGISRPAVSKWVAKGRQLVEEESGLELFD